jgi:hypothetical protein
VAPEYATQRPFGTALPESEYTLRLNDASIVE